MTLVKKQKEYNLYFDDVLASTSDSKGIVIKGGYHVYFGGSPRRAAATYSQYDNIQMFNKALTLEQISELALANEAAVTGQNKPKSTILFDDSLILALDFEQEEISRIVDDVTCS